MRCAFAVCALAVSASTTTPDTTGLVQSGARVRGSGEDNELAVDSPNINSTALARVMLGSFFRRRYQQLFRANKTVPLTLQGEPGCSSSDRQMAMKRMNELERDMVRGMQRVLPKVMEIERKSRGQMTEASLDDFEKTLEDEVLGSLAPTCKRAMEAEDVDFNLLSSLLSSCVKDVLKVSDSCVNCLPQFGQQVQQACASTCSASMTTVAHELDKTEVDVEKKVMHRGAFAGPPSQADLMDTIAEMQKAMVDGMKEAVPCFECMSPKVTAFAKCTGGDAFAHMVEEESKEMIDRLKKGDLMPMGSPFGSGGFGGGKHPGRPLIPM